MPPFLFCVGQHLEGSPETVNESPYEKGWFVKIKVRGLRVDDGI